MNNQPEVEIDSDGPEILVFCFVQLVELQTRRKRPTDPPINNGRSVMDSFYGRRVWSWSSSSWPPRGSAVGWFVPEERDGTKRVLSQSWNGFEHAGSASEEAFWRDRKSTRLNSSHRCISY